MEEAVGTPVLYRPVAYEYKHIHTSAPFLTPPLGPRVFGMFHQASDREAIYACFTFSHWLVYANSAANPIIYNFLSGEWAGEAEWPKAATVPRAIASPSSIQTK